MKSTPFHRKPSFKTGSSRIVGLSILVLAAGLCLVGARAGSFSFSTGDPDARAATASRLASAGKIQVETADDFVLTENTIIQQASFVGLLPAGAALSSISEVEVEFYNAFPLDSTNPPSGQVPTRVNSPSDTEIVTATSDSVSGTLTFTSSIMNATFAASTSVLNGINPIPNQTTGGEGGVTGEEVLITVTFNPPITLPAGHYFFRPAVLLSSGDFLWLSTAFPIVAPGTPFVGDLESWIRNETLAPDWLRIGTDITAQGQYNAAFTLSGELDADGDGVPDELDQCAATPANSVVNAQGCSLDQLVPCAGPAAGGTWMNHGQYVSTFTQTVNQFVAQGLISRKDKGHLTSQAARSNCGKGNTGGGSGGHGHGHGH
jgi:hypothetical protein